MAPFLSQASFMGKYRQDCPSKMILVSSARPGDHYLFCIYPYFPKQLSILRKGLSEMKELLSEKLEMGSSSPSPL